MRKTKITAIIMLIIASMLASVMPVWATAISSIDTIELELKTTLTSTDLDYHPYIYGTTYGEEGWSQSANSLGLYGKKGQRGYATLNYSEIEPGKDFAAYGIKYDAAKDYSAYASASVTFGQSTLSSTLTDATVSPENLYYAIMTEGQNGEIVFHGVPVPYTEQTDPETGDTKVKLESKTAPISDFVYLGTTGTDKSLNLAKFLGLGLVRMKYTGEGTQADSSGRIYIQELSIKGLKAIDDLEATIDGNKPVISFTAPTLAGLTYKVRITGDDGSEDTVTLEGQSIVPENGKIKWKHQDAVGQVTYTYKVILEYAEEGLTSESNTTEPVTVPEDFGGETAPEDGKSLAVASVNVRNTKNEPWAYNAFGTSRISGETFNATDSCSALSESDTILSVKVDYNCKFQTEEEAKTYDKDNPSFLLDYYTAGYSSEKISKGGADGTATRSMNISSAAQTGVAVFKVYIEGSVDLTNAYFAIGQRWYGGAELRHNFAGVPVLEYLTDDDKGKVKTVAIPLSDFKKSNEKSYHVINHYNFDWEAPPTADKADVDLKYFNYMGILVDCKEGPSSTAKVGKIYISDMGVYDIKPVTNLEVRESSPSKIVLGWEHPETLTKEYNIYREFNGVKERLEPTPLNRFADTKGFAIGDEVKYYVSAVNEVGAESIAQTVSVKIGPIGKPNRFSVRNNYSDTDVLSIDIDWDAPTYGEVAKYVLYRNGAKYKELEPGVTSVTDTKETGVVYGNEYAYRVLAVDAVGNESIKTEEIKVIAAAVSTVTGFTKDITENSVTFSWNATEYAEKYELTVNGVPQDVDGLTKTVNVSYKEQIIASVKAVNAAGAKSFISELPAFAIYDPAELGLYKDEDKVFEDTLRADFKMEASQNAEFYETSEKAIFGSKSLKCDFTKMSVNELRADMPAAKWDIDKYIKNNAKLSFWIYGDEDIDYNNVAFYVQMNEKIEDVDKSFNISFNLSHFINETGKWVYVEIPFVNLPVDGTWEYNGAPVQVKYDYTKTKGLGFAYRAGVTNGATIYVDDIMVKSSPIWTPPTLADDQGNPVASTISADAKSLVLTFAEAMDSSTITTDNIWIESVDDEGKTIDVVNSFVSYADNKCTINFLEQLAKNTNYRLHIVDVKSAKGVTSTVELDATNKKYAAAFRSGTEDYTGELEAPTAIAPVIAGTTSGSTVTVSVSMPKEPVYTVGNYSLTLTYDKTLITPNGTTATTLKKLEGATVDYGDGAITITGNAGEKALSGVLAEILFSTSTNGYASVTVSGTMDVKNVKAGETYSQAVSATATVETKVGDTIGSVVGSSPAGSPSGGTAPRDHATIKGNETVNPTEGESVGEESGAAVFTDVNSVPWATEAITALVKEGIISGYPDNTVKPEKTITREEFAALLVRAFSFKSELTESPFADVAGDAWYAKAIIVAHEKGIVSGVNDSDFGIGSTITREDMCTMIYRAMQAARMSAEDVYDSYQFADDAQISQYAKDAITALYKSGVISGVSDTEFAPKAEVNRAMAARVLYGVMGMM